MKLNIVYFLTIILFNNRDQITTTEVNMARLHNWAVKQKQQNKK